MKDYIEREAVLDMLCKGDWKRTDEEKVAVLNCYDRIKKIPAADVVEVDRLLKRVHEEFCGCCMAARESVTCEGCATGEIIAIIKEEAKHETK